MPPTLLKAPNLELTAAAVAATTVEVMRTILRDSLDYHVGLGMDAFDKSINVKKIFWQKKGRTEKDDWFLR